MSPEQIREAEKSLKIVESMINSMTPSEFSMIVVNLALNHVDAHI